MLPQGAAGILTGSPDTRTGYYSALLLSTMSSDMGLVTGDIRDPSTSMKVFRNEFSSDHSNSSRYMD